MTDSTYVVHSHFIHVSNLSKNIPNVLFDLMLELRTGENIFQNQLTSQI